MSNVGKTLKELNPKIGDILVCVKDAGWGHFTQGKEYTVSYLGVVINDKGEDTQPSMSLFYIKTNQEPKLWKDMTPEEKGALLLAHHEGKVIEFTSARTGMWLTSHPRPSWKACLSYRIKPEPKVETKELFGSLKNCFSDYQQTGSFYDTHKLTFNIVDGEIDCSSVKMEKL